MADSEMQQIVPAVSAVPGQRVQGKVGRHHWHWRRKGKQTGGMVVWYVLLALQLATVLMLGMNSRNAAVVPYEGHRGGPQPLSTGVGVLQPPQTATTAAEDHMPDVDVAIAKEKTKTTAGTLSAGQKHSQSQSHRPVHGGSLWQSVDNDICSRDCSGIYDVIIVGGGISGLYAAWRLQKADRSLKIAVVEATERTGGRLFSVRIPGMPNLAADLGGMHYLSNPEKMLTAWLVERVFNLTTHAFAQNTSDPRSSAFLRNTHLHADQLRDPGILGKIYHVNPGEIPPLDHPNALYQLLFSRTVNGFGDAGFDAWSAVTTDGRKLTDVTLRDLQDLSGMSQELWRLGTDLTGYNGGEETRASAAIVVDMLTNVLLGQFGDYRVPTPGGMETIPERLRAEFEALDGKVMCKSKVTAMAKCPQQHADNSSNAALQLVVDSGGTGGIQTFCTDKVILALTEPALAELWWRPLMEDSTWQNVQAAESFKLFLGFDKPWWRHAPFGFYEGAAVSTLDISHSYFLGTEADYVKAGSDRNENSLVLAAYAISTAAPRWNTFNSRVTGMAPFQGRPNPFVNGSSSVLPDVNTGFEVSQLMVDFAIQQLEELHGVNASTIPAPYTAVAKAWPNCYHEWKAGINPTDTIRRVTQLDPKQNVYICGEAYSKSQAWAEGSLRSVEFSLRKYFGLAPLHGMPNAWISRYPMD